MANFTLKDIDSDDLSDLLEKIEQSFNIKFERGELIHITNFGELCDHITNKLQLENIEDCSSQQAFYKLRSAISTELGIDPKEITTQQKLEKLLPEKTRRSNLKNLEQKLGFKLKVLTSPNWLIFSLLGILILSLISFLFNWKIAVSGILFSFIGFWLANLTANKISVETVGELAKKISRENYLKSRRDEGRFNKREIEVILTDWFSDEFGLKKSELGRDAKLV